MENKLIFILTCTILVFIGAIISAVIYALSFDKKCTPDEIEKNPYCTGANSKALGATIGLWIAWFVCLAFYIILRNRESVSVAEAFLAV